MAGTVFTGGNTSDLLLGRGIVLFKGDQPGTHNQEGWRDLGNCTEFQISFESETKEHQSFLSGLKVIDKEILVSQKMSVSITLDELNFKNLALFTLGFVGGASATGQSLINPALTDSNLVGAYTADNVFLVGPLLFQWFDLEMIPALFPSEKRRGFNFLASQIVDNADVHLNPTDRTTFDGTALREKTPSFPNGDYEIDRKLGRIRFLSGGPASLGGSTTDEIAIRWAQQPGGNAALGLDANLDSIAMLASSGFSGGLRLLSVNPSDENHVTDYTFHSVNLKPDGDLGLITDEFATMTLVGTVQAESVAPFGLSQYADIVTARSYNT